MFQILKPAMKLFIVMTIVTGVVYPLLVTGFAQLLFREQANGSLLSSHGAFVGSELIAQNFESLKYFWPRPSAGNYNPLSSGGTNLGPLSIQLKERLREQKERYKEPEVPQDLLFSSGSGLDPHISPAAALYQADRVAKERNLNEEQKKNLVSLVKASIEDRQFGFLGEKRVNVLKLNLALDKM